MMFSIYTFDAPFGRQAASPASGLARRYDGSFGCRGPHFPFRHVCRAITTEIRDRDDRAPIRLIRNVNDGGRMSYSQSLAEPTPSVEMFWWFERKGELLRVEVLQVSEQQFELRVIEANGDERMETFSNAQDLSKRQEEVLTTISHDGWSGPHGWVI